MSVASDRVRLDPTGPRPPLVVVGKFGVQYRANTVYEVDANLECLRPDHPDVDLLLDVRRVVSVLNAIWPVACSLCPERVCPSEQFTPCECARDRYEG